MTFKEPSIVHCPEQCACHMVGTQHYLLNEYNTFYEHLLCFRLYAYQWHLKRPRYTIWHMKQIESNWMH